MIFALLIAVASAGYYGVDLANAVSVTTIQCLRNLGFSDFFIFRSWQSLGRFDPNAYQNNMNAISAGFSASNIDCYFYPCISCGDLGGQVNSFWSNVVSYQLKVQRVWFDVEGTWTSSYSTNQNYLMAMVNQARTIGIVAGIYSSYYQWENIFTLSYQFAYTNEYPLWYAHYDSWDSFGDFNAFAGWSTPKIKQYNGDMWTCDFDVDYNYKE